MYEIQEIFKSKECDISFNVDLHIIESKWKGVGVTGERLRHILNMLILALDLKKASIIVADARKMRAIIPADQQWILDDWYPRAVKAGFRHQVLILEKDSFNELTVNNITQEYDKTIVTTHYSDSHEEAIDWVSKLPNATEVRH